MHSKNFLAILFVLLILVLSCKNNDNKQIRTYDKNPELHKPKTLDDILMIYKFIPLSSHYDQIKIHYPNLSELKAQLRFFVANLDTIVFDLPTQLEFRFKNLNKLSGIKFKITDVHCSNVDSLYKYLQNYYSTQIGDYREEVEKDPSELGYPIEHASYWVVNDMKLTVFLNEYPGNCVLNWDFN